MGYGLWVMGYGLKNKKIALRLRSATIKLRF